jgi:Flp pilus assembly protein TadG
MKQKTDSSSERGVVLYYVAAMMVVLLLFAGLAIDLGRGYVLKANLSKAVDGAALAAARALGSGDPRTEAIRIFRANFPANFLGVTSVTDPATDPNFFQSQYITANGVNIITINAQAVMPTTFMRIGNFQQMTVSAMGEATRRLVDLSLVLDTSSSLGAGWADVRDASRTFVNSFSNQDRISLILYNNGGRVIDAMPSGRTCTPATVASHIPTNNPGGSTAMDEGLYRGWDEMRSVPNGQQSGLRVIVLFTDGCTNSVPGTYEAAPGIATGLRTYDFPKRPNDNGQTWDSPNIVGLFEIESGTQSPSYSLTTPWNSTATLAQVPYLPAGTISTHTHHRSSGIPTSFPLYDASLSAQRTLRNFNSANSRYPADVWNINNAARNLLEILADRIHRDSSGDYPIRIYTIGMGALVRMLLGTRPETGESMLQRIANDPDSPDYNSSFSPGKYYYAQTSSDVNAAFQALRSQILRLSK